MTVTITGAEDAPVISGETVGEVSEDLVLSASGTLAITDADLLDNPVGFSDVLSTVGDSGYGSFELVGGAWTYTLDNDAVQSLDAGQTVSDSITFTATDGSTQTVTVTITGAEDVPVILLVSEISVVNSSLMRGETSEIWFTFSEPVLEFDNSDISVLNGELSPVESLDGGISWSAVYTPANDVVAAENAISVDLGGILIESTGGFGSGTTAAVFAIDTTAARPADLSVTISDSQDTYVPGSKVTYSVIVSNQGLNAVEGAVVSVPMPVGAVAASWTATRDGETIGAGNGPIERGFTIPAGGSVAITFVATVSPTATSGLAAYASVTAPAGLSDPDLTNNGFLDVDTVALPSLIVASSDVGAGPAVVQLIDSATGERREFGAFEASFVGGVNVATADLTGDGIDEMIVAPGRGRLAEIRVYTQWGVELPAYRTVVFPGFTGGVQVAAGDLTGDRQADIIVSMAGGKSEVRVFEVTPGNADPVANAPRFAFRPFGNGFAGGVAVAVADVGRFERGVTLDTSLADGRHELVVGSGAGMPPTIKVYDLSGGKFRMVDTVTPFKVQNKLGIMSLAVGRLDGDAIDDIIVASAQGLGGIVTAFSGRVDDRQDARLMTATPFTSPKHRHAALSVAAIDGDGDGRAERVLVTQGSGGDVGLIRHLDPAGQPVAASAGSSRVGTAQVRVAAANSGLRTKDSRIRISGSGSLTGAGTVEAKAAAFAGIAAEVRSLNADGFRIVAQG